MHYGLDAHGDSLLGNFIYALEEPGVYLSCVLFKVYHMSEGIPGRTGLVECDVSVYAYAEDLKIDAAGCFYLSVVGFDILKVDAVGNMSS